MCKMNKTLNSNIRNLEHSEYDGPNGYDDLSQDDGLW
jgi:hypothetical protein